MVTDLSLRTTRRPAKILIPLLPESDNESLLTLAHWLAESEPVLLLGMVPIPEGENLSVGASMARELRKLMQAHIDRVNLRRLARIRVTYMPWDDIRVVISKNPRINLLILEWPGHLEALNLTAAEILSHPPCDISVVRGPFQEEPSSIMVVNRGGPHAERALRLGIAIARSNEASVTSLNIRPSKISELETRDFEGMVKILNGMPDVKQHEMVADDQATALLKASKDHNIVILGTVGHPEIKTESFGKIADTMLKKSPAAVIATKTERLVPERTKASEFSSHAISVLVDRWFAESTFHADEFANIQDLVDRKREQDLKISLVLPALNEEATLGDIIRTIKRTFMGETPLLDEIVLMDSNSKDRTREIASDLGIPVYIHQEVLSKYGARAGKGEALWKSLYVTEGDLIFWVDTDIKNFHPRFVYGLIGPFLRHPKLKLAKGFYRRPLKNHTGLKPGRGGRVTELSVRPLLNLFYPELSGIVQPLAGEYGGRREGLEQIPFMSGYGVEIGILIEAYEKFDLSSIAQVDMVERIHRNRDLSYLGRMSFAIIQTLFSKLEKRHGHAIVEDLNRTMKTVRYESGLYYLQVEEMAERERPPMIKIPEYRKKHGLPALP